MSIYNCTLNISSRDIKTDEIINEYKAENMLVNDGREILLRCVTGDYSYGRLDRTYFGNSAVTPSISDTISSMGTIYDYVNNDNMYIDANITLNIIWTIGYEFCNRSIQSIGIGSERNYLFNRVVIPEYLKIVKTPDVIISGVWTISLP